MKKTTIAGIELELVEGKRYRAARSMARQMGQLFWVEVVELPNQDRMFFRNGLTYEEANAFVNEFNNGESSFSGRIW